MTQPDDIFPLPLSDFETYAFRDDSVDQPMVIVLRTSFEGPLNEAAFRQALTETLGENPLLRSTVDVSGWQAKWKLQSDRLPSLDVIYSEQEPATECVARHRNLKVESGVHFELRISPERGCLVSYFHHACVDGLGAIRFLGDVFARYGCATAIEIEGQPIVRTTDHSTLLKRGSRRRASHQQCAPLLHTIKEAFKLFTLRSYRLPGRRVPAIAASSNSLTEQNMMHSCVLPRTQVKELKRLSSHFGATLNDLCLMVFLQQMAEWSRHDPRARQRDVFRILMPVSMRTPDHDEMSAGNVVSYVFHTYRRRQLECSRKLLDAIRDKSSQMVGRNEGAAMLYGFAVARLIPGLFRLSQKLQPDFATAALTNVGEVRRIFENRFPMKHGRAVAGNVVIQRVDGVAPVRDNTNLTMAFGTYGGEMMIHLNRNAKVFSAAATEQFLSRMQQRLTAMARTGELSPTVATDPQSPEQPALAAV